MDDRPNILLITTDQQRFDTLQCAGNDRIWTPHLNWLCDNGVRFSNAYSDCPVCMPARVTMMSGRHAYHHRMMSNKWVDGAYQEEDGLAGLLTAAGYQTRLIGKNHNGPSGRHLMGFQSQVSTAAYHRFYARHPHLARVRASGLGMNEHVPGVDTAPEEHSLSHWLVDQTCDYLEMRDPSMPFFAWLSFDDPHPPFLPCTSYAQLYHGAPVPEPILGDWSTAAEDVPPAFLGVTWELSMTQRLGGEQLAQVRRAYYALITQIDAHLGLLFGRLGELGLLENTWILFTSDHGEMLGDHHLGGKCVPFEGAAHVPLIVKPPATPRDCSHPLRGAVSDALVCLADILPTCLKLGRVEIDPALELDGIDLLAAAQGTAHREALYGDCMYLHYVRQGGWKYCLETLGNHEFCFDLNADPQERRDLIAAGESRQVVERLRTQMRAHLDRHDLWSPGAHDAGVAQSDQDMPRNTHPGFRSWRAT
jgi:arylsulfatase A-like enzyme